MGSGLADQVEKNAANAKNASTGSINDLRLMFIPGY
jgi:hypothetical protein